jgi:hypothetical protein
VDKYHRFDCTIDSHGSFTFKKFFKSFSFCHQNYYVNFFIALLHFGDIMCGCELLIGSSDYWTTPIHHLSILFGVVGRN